MVVSLSTRAASNWTSAAGALEGVLAFLGSPLPRHAIMGLTGHAWHFCLGSREGIVALPSGAVDLDWEAMTGRYARTGWRWERFGAILRPGDDWTDQRQAAIDWAVPFLDRGVPLMGWDFHLHEHAVVHGYDRERGGFFVDDVLSGENGSFAPWTDWPSSLGILNLFAPTEPFELDPIETIAAALETALECLAGRDGPADGQPRGTAGLDAWSAAMDAETEVDRPGNAYLLAVLQAARLDGAAFLEDVAGSIPELASPLGEAARAIHAETQALSPLLTLFPFPSGGHGNVNNAGLRRGAAMALRRAAEQERRAGTAIEEALRLLAQE